MTTIPSTTPLDDPKDDEGDLTRKQKRILDYLTDQAEERTYFKSRSIGQVLGLSAKEVGRNIARIREGDVGIDIEPWGYSSGTTWQVTK